MSGDVRYPIGGEFEDTPDALKAEAREAEKVLDFHLYSQLTISDYNSLLYKELYNSMHDKLT